MTAPFVLPCIFGCPPAVRPRTTSRSRTSAVKRRGTAHRTAERSSPTMSSARQERRPADLDHPGARRRSHEQHDPPDHGAVREYQSKENAKHTLRSDEGERGQGFWNGALPPSATASWKPPSSAATVRRRYWRSIPSRPKTVRLIFRLTCGGNGSLGQWASKSISTKWASAPATADAGASMPCTRCSPERRYVGRHRFNTKYWKSRERKPEAEVVEMAVPPIIGEDEFEAVQTPLKTRGPALTAPRIVSGPTLLTGICFCADAVAR